MCMCMYAGDLVGSGNYTVKASSYLDPLVEKMWTVVDHQEYVQNPPAAFALSQYSTLTGDFKFNGDSRFTLDGIYYGICISHKLEHCVPNCHMHAYGIHFHACNVHVYIYMSHSCT